MPLKSPLYKGANESLISPSGREKQEINNNLPWPRLFASQELLRFLEVPLGSYIPTPLRVSRVGVEIDTSCNQMELSATTRNLVQPEMNQGGT